MDKLSRRERREQRQAQADHGKSTKSRRLAPVQPRTPGQLDYHTALQTYDMVIGLGPAGAGKTFLASAQISQLFKDGKIDKLVMCRPAVEVEGEKHGFLPGTLRKKMDPWVLPVIDVLNERLGKKQVEDLERNGSIEVVPFGLMRGRTFKDAAILLDEAQNVSLGQMKLFMGRIGENAKTYINGDLRQCDLPGGDPEGLRTVRDIALSGQIEGCQVVELSSADIVRSAMCASWTKAFAELAN